MRERFDAKVVPEPTSGCYLWIGSYTGHGYGSFWTGTRNERAHRVAWQFAHGPIPNGQEVCHRCDVPSCVNPDHLFLGTHQRNMRDSFDKGRSRPAVSVETQFKPQTHCPRGHARDEGSRECRACKAERESRRVRLSGGLRRRLALERRAALTHSENTPETTEKPRS